MKKNFSLLLITALSSFLFPQEASEPSPFTIKFSGFVKTDTFYDSRQTVTAREGFFNLYPSPTVTEAETVSNTRILLSNYFFF